MEDAENWTNLRIKGLPEATADVNMCTLVWVIRNMLINKSPTVELDQDRIHHAPLSRTCLSFTSQVMLCIYLFTTAEEILCTAWQKGNLDFNEAQIHVLPDLSHPGDERPNVPTIG